MATPAEYLDRVGPPGQITTAARSGNDATDDAGIRCVVLRVAGLVGELHLAGDAVHPALGADQRAAGKHMVQTLLAQAVHHMGKA